MPKGQWRRGFSVSVSSLPGSKLRVIVWCRDSRGNCRTKISDQVMEANSGIQLKAPPVGGMGRRQDVTVVLENRVAAT